MQVSNVVSLFDTLSISLPLFKRGELELNQWFAQAVYLLNIKQCYNILLLQLSFPWETVCMYVCVLE